MNKMPYPMFKPRLISDTVLDRNKTCGHKEYVIYKRCLGFTYYIYSIVLPWEKMHHPIQKQQGF